MLSSIMADFMPLTVFGLGFGLGLMMLLAGGYWLVPASVSLAIRAKLPPRLIASVIIAGGTSAPELLVSVDAGLTDSPDIALANIIGSNITNIFLVFGMGILLMPVSLASPRDRQDIFWLMILTMAVSVILLADLFSGTLGTIIGLCLCISFFLLTFGQFASRQSPAASLSAGSPATGSPAAAPQARFGLGAAMVITLIAVMALIAGAHLMVANAVSIATSFGIEQAVIGATIVAIGTSLPEITAVFASLLHRRHDMAVGNIIGSNIFNICIVLGITAMAAPLPASQSLLMTILPFFILSGALLSVLGWKFAYAGRTTGIVFLGLYGCFASLCFSL